MLEGCIVRQFVMTVIICLALPSTAIAQEEKKGFWASLVPDNSSAVKVVGAGKDFFAQLFTDTADTGKVLLNKGKEMIDATGETIKSVTDGE